MRRIIRIVIGWSFIVLGILGLFLPILQGILFLCVGGLLLADDVPLFRRLINRIETKWPRTRGPFCKARGWLGQHRHLPQPDDSVTETNRK